MPTLVLIGLACWLVIVIVVLAALRAASHADDVADRHARALAGGGEATAPFPLPTDLPGAARRRHLASAETATVALVAGLSAPGAGRPGRAAPPPARALAGAPPAGRPPPTPRPQLRRA